MIEETKLMKRLCDIEAYASNTRFLVVLMTMAVYVLVVIAVMK